MQKNISFKGITRNTDNLLAVEGECSDLVNLRLKDGSLSPIAKPEILYLFHREYSMVYYHEKASAYLCVTSSDGQVHLYDKNFKPFGGGSQEVLLSADAVGVRRIEFSGNIVSLFTYDATLYAIYDSGIYKWLGERPEMPSISFTVESYVHQLTTTDEYYAGLSRNEEKASLYWKNASKGYFDECISKLNEQGCYIDRALFRYAFRLFDGSYICCSPIYYVDDDNSIDSLSRDGGNFYSKPAVTSGVSVYTVKVQGFKPVFHFEPFNLAAWENIIISLDIFSSGSIPGHKVVNNGNRVTMRNDGVYTSSSYGYEQYVFKNTEELWNDVTQCSMFHKVAEYDLSGRLTDSLKNVSSTQLVLSDMLPADVASPTSRSAEFTYVFNGRLHLASLREKLFKGYNADCYLPANANAVYISAAQYTELKTVRGTALVRCDYDSQFPIGYDGENYYLSPLITYPDTRAKKMTLFLTIDGKCYRRSFIMNCHKTLNMAYYLNTRGGGLQVMLDTTGCSATGVRLLSAENVRKYFSYKTGEYTLVYTQKDGWMWNDKKFTLNTDEDPDTYYAMISWRKAPDEGDTLLIIIGESISGENAEDIEDIKIDSMWDEVDGVADIPEANTMEERGNVLKVSAVDNPFCFPARQNYTPSNERIIALCSNTVALSQGQFGEHPLYVFCENGIWAMGVDTSGEIAYSCCYPLSREVCINSSSVCGIDSGVVFITSKGVMLLEGGGVALLSQSLDDFSKPFPYNVQSVFSRIAAITNMENLWCDKSFSEYCSKAIIGFNYAMREIIVSNSSFPYSYIFSLNSGAWSRYSYSFAFIINSYPGFKAITSNSGKTSICALNNDVLCENSVLLVSRPMTWGGKLYKRVLQMMLHATVSPATGSAAFNGLACYLLCSNDGINFKLVTGSERRQAFNDMVFPYMPTQSYRYFAIAITGNIMSDSKITSVELYIDTAWNNRLR